MKHLTAEQAQERLGIRRPTLYAWVRKGKLHPIRAGHALLFEEEEVMKLLGRGPRVPVWILGGGLEAAKARVRQLSRSGAAPHFLVEYLDAPGKEFIRSRVIAVGDGMEIQVPAPGGPAFERLLEALKRGEYAFLGQEESVWNLADVRPETGPSGIPYIALELTRVKSGNGRDSRLREIVERMRAGVAAGVLEPYRREELYERGAR